MQNKIHAVTLPIAKNLVTLVIKVLLPIYIVISPDPIYILGLVLKIRLKL